VITYVDASVVLRLLQGEADALESWTELMPVSSQLTKMECLRVIDRARISGATTDEVAGQHRATALAVLATFSLVPVSDATLERAADPFPTALGTLDAIHLATALQLRGEFPDLEFATHDRELAVAARAVGFAVHGA